jgi:hypothetical protein
VATEGTTTRKFVNKGKKRKGQGCCS